MRKEGLKEKERLEERRIVEEENMVRKWVEGLGKRRGKRKE